MFRLWVSAALAVSTAALLAQETPVFRSNVNLVRVVATVRDRTGALIGALNKDDFEIYDNGVRQEIAVFDRQTGQPLSVSLLVDVSGSTNIDLKYETVSAAKFLHALLMGGNPQDQAALYSFDDAVQLERNFTHNYASLDAALKKMHGSAGTSLYDAIFLAARDLESRQGRKVLVIVSDGGNTTSTYDTHQALQAAQMADAVIYPVVVMPITNDAGRNIGGENALTFMAQGTGGRTFLPALGKQLDKAFEDIIAELRTEYVMGFYPHNVPLTKDKFHRLDVKARRTELQVSARNGYYGDAEGDNSTPEARVSLKPAAAPRKKQ
jgi:Ca-activated chloride channel family protein